MSIGHWLVTLEGQDILVNKYSGDNLVKFPFFRGGGCFHLMLQTRRPIPDLPFQNGLCISPKNFCFTFFFYIPFSFILRFTFTSSLLTILFFHKTFRPKGTVSAVSFHSLDICPFTQCCGSGSVRIRIIFKDPDPFPGCLGSGSGSTSYSHEHNKIN